MDVFKLFATLGLDAAAFNKGLAGAEQRFNAASQTFSNAGRTLTAGLTAPIVGVGAAALTSGINFESAFAGVRKTVDATEEEFAMLERGILAMTQRIPASATEVARVAAAAGQLGVETDSILEFTEVMIGLGEATEDLNADQAAMEIARFMNIMQTAPSDVSRLASTVVGLGNNVAATEGEITHMAMRMAAAGNLIGLTEADVLGLAATMTSLGINAEAGGTAMSRVMRTIMSAVLDGGEDLQTFADITSTTAEQFAATFTGNPMDAIMMFSNGLARIRDEGANVEDALDALGLSDVRVSGALLSMSGSGEVLANTIQLATQAWQEDIALQDEVSRRYETTESQLQILKNSMTLAAITLGDALLPLVKQLIDASKPLIERLQGLVEWFGNLDPKMQTFIVAGAAVTAALGPIFWGIGAVANGINSLLPLLRLVPGAFAAIRGALGLLTGPIGWIITAISAIALVWSTDLFGLKTMAIEAWETISSNFMQAWEDLKEIGRGIGQFATDLVDNFRGLWRGIQETSAAIEQTFRDWWTAVWSYLTGLPQQMIEFGKDLMQGLINGVRSMVTGAVDAVKGVGQNVIDSFKSLLGIASPSTVFYAFGLDIGEGLAQGIEASETRVARAVGSLATAAQRTMSGAFDAEAIVAQMISGKSSEDAARLLKQRMATLQQTQADLLYNQARGGRLHRVAMPMVNQEMRAVQEALERNSRQLDSLDRRLAEVSRERDTQTRRFTLAVDTFSGDVRGMTLAAQRY